MNIVWSAKSWDDYLYWQKVDKKLLKRVNVLIKSCIRTPLRVLENLKLLKEICKVIGRGESLQNTDWFTNMKMINYGLLLAVTITKIRSIPKL